MRRREFITLLGGAAAWPLAAGAQQADSPTIGYFSGRSSDAEKPYSAAFRQGLEEAGYVDGRNVRIEYRFSNGQEASLPAIAADLVRQQVAVLVATDGPSARAAKRASQILNATTIGEIDAAFATLALERPDALFVAGDAFLVDRRVQLATLTARDRRIPAAYGLREYVTVGGLMSYGTDITDMFHQVGVYTGSILKGAKPAELPVLQSTKFEFVINLQTARALGIDVPPGILSIADEVIE